MTNRPEGWENPYQIGVLCSIGIHPAEELCRAKMQAFEQGADYMLQRLARDVHAAVTLIKSQSNE